MKCGKNIGYVGSHLFFAYLFICPSYYKRQISIFYKLFHDFFLYFLTFCFPIFAFNLKQLGYYQTLSSFFFRFTGVPRRSGGGHGELNLASVIFSIVVIFVICHLPRMVLAVLAVVNVNKAVECIQEFNKYHPPLIFMYAEVNIFKYQSLR